MTITVSEDLNSGPRGKMRFCATLNDDTDQERGGFGASERSALWSLAQQLNIHPGTLQVTATIERVAFR
jgi:hypothetical protein